MNRGWCLSVVLIPLFYLSSCQTPTNFYEQVQFKEIVLCQGLDREGIPIIVNDVVTTSTQIISLCLNIETDQEFSFVMHSYGPNFATRAVLKAKQSGWLVTAITPNGKSFSPGEYKVRIIVLKTQKATKTFKVVEERE